MLPISMQSSSLSVLNLTIAGCSANDWQPLGRDAAGISWQMLTLYEYPSASGPDVTTPSVFNPARSTPSQVHLARSHLGPGGGGVGVGGGGVGVGVVHLGLFPETHPEDQLLEQSGTLQSVKTLHCWSDGLYLRLGTEKDQRRVV